MWLIKVTLLLRDSLLLVETGNSNFLRRSLIPAGGNDFGASEKDFFFFHFQTLMQLLVLFFRLVETYFKTNFSFQLVEIGFLASENHFFSHFIIHSW